MSTQKKKCCTGSVGERVRGGGDGDEREGEKEMREGEKESERKRLGWECEVCF